MATAVEREATIPGEPQARPRDALRQSLLLAAGVALGLGLLAGLWLFARPLVLVGIGVVIGEALTPLVNWASRGLPRPFAVILLYLCIATVVITLLWFTLAPLVGQAQELVNSLPEVVGRVWAWVQRQDERVDNIPVVESLAGQLQGLAGRLFALPMTVVSSLFDLLLVVFLSLYWLLAAPKLGHFIRSLLPEKRRERAGELMAHVGHTVGGYIRGVGINVIVVTIVSYIGLRLIGLPFALVFAVIAGLFEVIPIVGAFISGALIVGFALSQSLQTALITLAFFVALQQLEGNVLTPMVMRSQTHIHPFLILVALVLGGSIGGLLGVLVAIPLAGALKVLTVELLAPALRRRRGES